MAFGTPLKALALVLFIAAIAAATYGVQHTLGDTVKGQIYGATPVQAVLNATPGHTVTYAVTLVNRGGATTDLAAQLAGDGVTGKSESRTVFAGGNATVFVPVNVTALSVGDHPLTLTVLDGSGAALRSVERATTLRVLAPAQVVFGQTDVGTVTYTGRLTATGGVFNSNDGALAGLNFVKAAGYSQSPAVPLQVQSGRVVTGFFEGILGMQPGESRSVSFGYDKGYGPATVNSSTPRTEQVDRVESRPLPEARLAASDFEGYLNDTNQGKIADYHIGSVVTNQRDGVVLRYRIVNISDAGYELRLDVKVGEKYTLHQAWPNASEVLSVGDANATFRTTPTTPLLTNFTWEATPWWPQMSQITDVNETTITIRHSPPVGFRYTVSGGFGGGQEYTVKALTDTDVETVTAASAPLAGKDLTFDIRLESITK